MNIWYIHPYAGGPGLGRYWRPYYFAKTWVSLGHKVSIISPSYHHLMDSDDKKTDTGISGIPYIFLPSIRYRANGFLRVLSMLTFGPVLLMFGLGRLIKREKPDLIVYSSPHPYGVISAWIIAKCCNAKLILEVRDIWPLSMTELFSVSRFHPFVIFTALVERLSYRLSGHVICLLSRAERHMRKKGLGAGKYTWIPNGIEFSADNNRLKYERGDVLDEVIKSRLNGRFVIVYMGSHGKPNMLHTLLLAAKELEDRGVDVVDILLVGQGERKAELEQMSQKLKLKSVKFYPQVGRVAALNIIKSSSAGYFSLKPTSLFDLGISPNKLFDYMSQGVPVIFSCCSKDNIVEISNCGFSVNPADPVAIANCINRLVNLSENERLELGENGRKYVQLNFDYKILSQKVLDIYEVIN